MTEVQPVESPPETGEISPSEFTRRSTQVYNVIRQDPEKYALCVAEIHTFLSMFHQGFEQMQHQMESSGFMGKMMQRFMGG